MSSLSLPAMPASRMTFVVLAALFANAAGHAFLLITLPGLGRQLGFSDWATGLVVGVPALVLSLSGPAWGLAADRWGRRPVLVAALSAAAVGTAALAAVIHLRLSTLVPVTAALAAVLAVRLAHGAVAGGLMPAAQAFLADVTPADRRASGMGAMGAAFGLGSIGGAALAWRSGTDGAVIALIGVAGAVGVAAAAVRLALRDAPRLPEQPRQGAATGGWALPRRLWPQLAITVCGLMAYGLLQQVTALRLQDAFGLDADAAMKRAGGIMMLTLAAMVFMQAVVVRRLRWPPVRLVRVGGLMALAGVSAATLSSALGPFTVATLCIGAGLGVAVPGNLACLSLRAGPAMQARAAGVNAIAQGIGLAAGPIVGAALHAVSPVAPYAAAAGALALLVVVAAWGGSRCSPDDAAPFAG